MDELRRNSKIPAGVVRILNDWEELGPRTQGMVLHLSQASKRSYEHGIARDRLMDLFVNFAFILDKVGKDRIIEILQEK